MKKIIITLAIGLTLGMVSSCDLTRNPKNVTSKDGSLVNVTDINRREISVMSRFRGMQGDIYEIVQDLQADQLSTTIEQANHYAGSLNWDGVTTADYDRRDVWIGYYQGIGAVNEVMEAAPSIEPAKGEEKSYNLALGTLHFMRAYMYANLALRYGTPYKASTAASDLCVPLILKVNYTERPTRATNEAIYNQIFNVDIAKAKTLLAARQGKSMSDEVTVDAVTALEARTRLYMSDWDGAYKAAKKLIDSGRYPLVAPDESKFVNMWVYDNSSEEILTLFVSRPDETTWINPYFGQSTKAKRPDGSKGVNNPSYLPTQTILDLYEDKDLRKSVYFEKQICNIKDNFYEFYVVSKRKGNPKYAATVNPGFTFWNGYVPNSMHAPKVFRIAEQYLIAAEAAYNLGQESVALGLINDLRVSRGLDKSTASGDALYELIKDERTRELAFEGFRLWDLRRWHMPVVRDNPQTGKDGSVSHLKKSSWNKYKADDYRMLWPIPANDLNTNESIVGQQNPGW